MVMAGCASKQVASTSDEQSTTLKGTGAGMGGGPVENVRQEPMVSVDTPVGGGAPDTSASRPAPEAGAAPPPPSAGGTAAAIGVAGPEDIYFDFDQYNIRSDARGVLEHNANWLRSQAGKSVIIEGHCDERGTLAYNLVLGEKRARSTKRYLEELGVPESRLHTTSYGEVRPFCKEHNEGCWSKNRRAHFVVQ